MKPLSQEQVAQFTNQSQENITDPFDVYMNEVIVPEVDAANNEKERCRNQFWTYLWTALFLVSVNALVVLYRTLMYHHVLRVDQLIFINIVALLIVCWPLYSWRLQKKQDVFATFLKFYGDFKYIEPDKELADDVGLPIVPVHQTAQAEHHIVGSYSGTKVEVRDTVYIKPRATGIKKIADGVVIGLNFGETLDVNMLLFEKHGFYRKSKMPNMLTLNDKINIPAANYFNIFATDAQRPMKFLCSAFFEKVLDIKDVFGARKMYVMAQDRQIKIFLEGCRIYFDNYKLWSRKIEYDKFRRLHKQFEEIFIFIETIQALLRNNHDELDA